VKRAAAVVVAYAALALLVVPVFPHFLSPNEFSRWALAAAIVDHHTLEITQVVPLIGGASFEDASEVNGRVYSNKAPGAALLGVPGYAIARGASMRVSLIAMRWLAATLPLLLLGLAFAWAARKCGASDERAATGTFALLFATPLFAYGLLNFSHALAAACLFGAWILLFVERHEFAAGALIGLAVLSEYPCAVAGVILIVCAWRRAAKIIAGGVPFAIVLALYNYAAFGSVFALSSGNERNAEFRALAHSGVFGIGLPNPITLLRLLCDPARGLFLFAPAIVAALIALPRARRALPREAFLALVLVPAALVVLYSGYPNWHAGWSVGPRYLVPAIPFLLFPIVFAAPTKLESLLIGAGLVTVVPLTLTFPFPDLTFAMPWATLAWPLLRDGLVAPNLLHFVASVAAMMIPFLIVVHAVVNTAPKRLFVLVGVVLTIAISALVAPTPDLTQRLRVGYIEEVYFERPGAMRRAIGGLPVPPSAAARAARTLAMPPTSWPF
jgi:hypothetical protein